MGAFFIGLGVAVLIGAAALVGLNLVEPSTADAFYTRYTVPLDTHPPEGGRLAHGEAEKKAERP